MIKNKKGKIKFLLNLLFRIFSKFYFKNLIYSSNYSLFFYY